MLRWILRLVGGLLALILVAAIGLGIWFSIWVGRYEEQLRAGSQIAKTRRGEIEYAVAGAGVHLLRIHGTPGGYDQSITSALSRPESIAGFKVIAISRPGYLRTPLQSGVTPADQADLYAALLDELNIKATIVHGVSGGAPSALQFALKYPQRTLGLVLVVPYLETPPGYEARLAPESALSMRLQDFAFWLGVEFMSEAVASRVMPSVIPGFESTDPIQMAMVREFGAGLISARLRAAGLANDMKQFETLGIETWPLEVMRVPTLILHGTKDENAPYEASKAAAARIPTAELVTFEGADHLMIVPRHRDISNRVLPFMRSLSNTGPGVPAESIGEICAPAN
jgi:pimeloyl-ACP methyl ester carboxylesterase